MFVEAIHALVKMYSVWRQNCYGKQTKSLNRKCTCFKPNDYKYTENIKHFKYDRILKKIVLIFNIKDKQFKMKREKKKM